MKRAFVLRGAQVVIDLGVLSLALWSACWLRYEGEVPQQVFKRVLFLWPYAVGLQYGVLALVGVPRFSWRYFGMREAVRTFGAVLSGSAVLVAFRVALLALFGAGGRAQYAYLPLGVIGIDCALGYLGLVAVRAARRLTSERGAARRLRARSVEPVPALLIGAGEGGLMVAKEIERRPELGLEPLGFLDDDAARHGSVLHGLRVLGSTEDLPRIAAERGAKLAVITISNASGVAVRRIAEICRQAGLRAQVVPRLHELVGGSLSLTRLRDVAIEDLLRREPVVLDARAIERDLTRRVVLVTGAGGSIGGEICRQIAGFGPARLLLLERAENALFEIHRELASAFPGLALEPCLGDAGDEARMRRLFDEHAPEVVFHAAAHKHVPLAEQNAGEAVRNNLVTTRRLADLAHERGLHAFVMISTDKAVNPTSVMGATKRAAEMYVQALATASKTRFVTVRFGNVLGSNGSVVPIFREQIARGGPLTVTHPDMKRYFMTIPEACQLVLEAAAMGKGGEIFILDMGEPVRILDLARDLVRLSGLDDDEIEIVFTGIRPGEKLFEELAIAGENAEKTRHPKIFVGRGAAGARDVLSAGIDALGRLVAGGSAEDLKAALAELVPEYGRLSGSTEYRAERADRRSCA